MTQIYHYTTQENAKHIFRLIKQGWLEFLLGSQEQSGHETGAYFSLWAPTELNDSSRPVSRLFGTKALPPQIICIELEVPDSSIEPKKPQSVPVVIKPIKGDRGKETGLAYYLTKGGAYQPPIGDSDDILEKTDCICIPRDCLSKVYLLKSAADKKVLETVGGNAKDHKFLDLCKSAAYS